jgi:GNAT superfamily N-acetyltransferase
VIPRELAEYAEYPSVFSRWPPDFDRVLTDRYCLVRGPNPFFSEVQRPRLDGAVEETVAEIRALVRESGHRATIWWLGASATPPDLHDRLLALGLREPEDRVRELVALATATQPEPGPDDVEVRRVETLEDYRRSLEVIWEAFDTPPERRDAHLEELERRFRSEQEHGSTASYLALIDGSPVATGRVAFCDRGALLFAGSTIPSARGRGAYRALVRARWDEAAERGTPALVTQAAPSSEPILRRLGFEEVCRLRRLEDPS